MSELSPDEGADDPVVGDEDKVRRPSAAFDDFEPGEIPVGPDGAPVLSPVGQGPALPAATPRNMICLRGPCLHYLETETFLASGNPKDTWDPEHGLKDPQTGLPVRMPRQVNRTCLVHPGTVVELTDENVYTCNRWDPIPPKELARLAKRRERHYQRHPDHLPPPDDVVDITRGGIFDDEED